MVSVESILGALAPITNIGRKTMDIEVRAETGTVVCTVRPIYSGEYHAVNRELISSLGDEIKQITQAEFFIKMRSEIVARCIVAVNGQTIPKTLTTGETWFDPETEEEVPVTITREEVLSELTAQWNPTVISDFHLKYTDFLTACEREAERAVKYDVDDIESEISYCEERLSTLKERLEKKRESKIEEQKELATDLEKQRKEQAEQRMRAMQPVSEPEVDSEETSESTLERPVETPTQPRKRIQPNLVETPELTPPPVAVADPVEDSTPAVEEVPQALPTRPVMPHTAAKRAEEALHQPFRAPQVAPERLEDPGEGVPVYTLDGGAIPILSDRDKMARKDATGPTKKAPQSLNRNFRKPDY